MKEVVAQKKWVYTLYQTDEGMVLSVVCGGVAMFNVDVLLSDEESIQIDKDERYLDFLAENIRNDPKKYMSNQLFIERNQ